MPLFRIDTHLISNLKAGKLPSGLEGDELIAREDEGKRC